MIACRVIAAPYQRIVSRTARDKFIDISTIMIIFADLMTFLLFYTLDNAKKEQNTINNQNTPTLVSVAKSKDIPSTAITLNMTKDQFMIDLAPIDRKTSTAEVITLLDKKVTTQRADTTVVIFTDRNLDIGEIADMEFALRQAGFQIMQKVKPR